MEKVKKLISKYLTPKVRTIIALAIIVLGSIFLINYSFFEPTYINKYISMNIYKKPANSYFDDQNFYNCVIDRYNFQKGTSLPYTANLTDEQLNEITRLSCQNEGITSAKGLEKLTKLTDLYVRDNQLASIDVSHNILLEDFNACNNYLSSINLSANQYLENVALTNNKLSEINLDSNINLKYLYIGENNLVTLTLDNNTKLKELYAFYNKLENFTLENNSNIETIGLTGNIISEINISNNANLKNLGLGGYDLNLRYSDSSGQSSGGLSILSGNNITILDISTNPLLSNLYLSNNQLTNLDVSKNTALEYLDVDTNQLTNLDLSRNTALTHLGVSNNQLTNLDVSKNTALKYLYAFSNKLTSLDVSKNTALVVLRAYDNQLTSLDVSQNAELGTLEVYNNQLTSLDVIKNTNLATLRVENYSNYSNWNQLTSLDVSTNTALTDLRVGGNQLTSLDLSQNTALEYLYAYNNQLTSLDVSQNTALKYLEAHDNQLTSLDVSKNPALEYLDVGNNKLTSLDVSKNTKLKKLNVENNKLISLDVSKNTALEGLYAYNIQLTTLDVSKNTKLKSLSVYKNQLTILDVSKNTALTYLNVGWNQLTSLDLSKNVALKSLYVIYNQITILDVSKNTALEYLYAYNNQLTTLDVSRNTALKNLDLQGNNFGDTINCYVGMSKSIVSPVILPSHLDNSITWKSNDESIATVDNNGNVVGKKIGTTTVKGTNKYYTITTNVNAEDITSDKYSIYNSDDVSYVYTKEDIDSEIIKSHLTLPEGISINIANNKIDILENNSVIKTFNIISFKSIDNHVIVKNNYILTQMIDVNDAINMISLTNGTSKISNNQLIIKYNGVTVDTIPIIYMNTNYKYDISEKYIYTRNDIGDVVKNNIDTNGDILIQDNHIKILYNDIELDSFNILTISFNDLEVHGKYIIIDPTSEISKELFLSKISKNNDNITFKILNKDNIEIGSTDSLIGNYLKVYYNNKEIDSYNISDVVQDYIEFDEKLKVEENKKVIYDVKVNTKLKNITSLIDTNGIIKIYDKNDNEVTDMESKVKTGYKIKIELSDKVEEYKLSVRGDTKGTGEVNILSVMKIVNHILKTEEFVGDEYYMAADLTGDNQILINDAMRIIKYILYGEKL